MTVVLEASTGALSKDNSGIRQCFSKLRVCSWLTSLWLVEVLTVKKIVVIR